MVKEVFLVLLDHLGCASVCLVHIIPITRMTSFFNFKVVKCHCEVTFKFVLVKLQRIAVLVMLITL